MNPLTQATINLIFALRDSLTEDGPSRLDFWDTRCITALQTAAAGASNEGEVLEIVCRKLQIPSLTAKVSKDAVGALTLIGESFQAWQRLIDREGVYILALAKLQNRTRKATKAAQDETPEY